MFDFEGQYGGQEFEWHRGYFACMVVSVSYRESADNQICISNGFHFVNVIMGNNRVEACVQFVQHVNYLKHLQFVIMACVICTAIIHSNYKLTLTYLRSNINLEILTSFKMAFLWKFKRTMYNWRGFKTFRPCLCDFCIQRVKQRTSPAIIPVI